MIKGLCFEQTHGSPTALASRYPPFVPLVGAERFAGFCRPLCEIFHKAHSALCLPVCFGNLAVLLAA